MKERLVILTEIISPYRIPVFNVLAQNPEIDLYVIFLAETDPVMRQWHVYKNEIQFSYEVLPSRRYRLGKSNLLVNRSVKATLQRVSPRVVLCGGYNYLASWQALHWARKNRIPFLMWMESTHQDHRNGRWLTEKLKKKFLKQCNGVVVPGKSSLEYAASFGFTTNEIFVAPNAVDNDFFGRGAEAVRSNGVELRKEKQLPLRFFLYVGRLIREKGVFDLVEAYGKLDMKLRESLALVFVGDGPDREELMRAASDVSPGCIQFHGFAQREELPSYYGLAETFTFPTHSDPWGLVVNEALASGLPVIASSAAGCAADLVEDGANGRVILPGNCEQLVKAMTEISSNTLLRQRMAQRGRELIVHHSPQSCAGGISTAALSFRRPRA